MKLENQVCNPVQSIRLKELGVIQESNYQWNLTTHAEPYLNVPPFGKVDNNGLSYAAFTVAELGVMMPDYIASDALYTYQQRRGNMDRKYPAKHEVSYWNLGNKILSTFKSDSEAECKASMLIYLLEKNLTTPAEVNERLKLN